MRNPGSRETEPLEESWSLCEGQERSQESGKQPEGRGLLDGKYEVAVASRNELFTGMRRAA